MLVKVENRTQAEKRISMSAGFGFLQRKFGKRLRRFIACLAAIPVLGSTLTAEQDTFRWMDFHSAKDQDTIIWVSRSLVPEKWTAIREIGVKYDAALVVTTLRATPQSPANADTFTIWSASLTDHSILPLITGVNLRWFEWLRFSDGAPLEPVILYDSCNDCPADTYFTAFRYDVTRHAWTARWMRGGQGAHVWSANPPTGADWTQVWAVVAAPDGHSQLATWNHFDYGKDKPAEDSVYRYDIDPFSGLERTLGLVDKEAETMEMRVCRAGDAVPGLARGQDSPICRQLLKPVVERKPVTTPPANNRGKSVPPGARK